MTLQIRIVKAPQSASLPQNNFIFDEGGGTVGRGPSNTWVLPDPERILSSIHCEFVFEAGCYHLIDLSTNGTFINGSPEPLGKGARARLTDGDNVELGDYCFAVSMDAGTQDNIFSAPDDALDMASPFASDSDFPDAPFGNNYSDGQPPLSLNAEPDAVDPLEALDKASGTDANSALFGTEAAESVGDLLFSPASNQIAGEQVGSDAVAWPEAVPENVIPDDWDLDEDLGFSQNAIPSIEGVSSSSAGVGMSAESPFGSASIPQWGFMEEPEQQAPEQPEVPPRPALHVPVQPLNPETPGQTVDPWPKPVSSPQQDDRLSAVPSSRANPEAGGNVQPTTTQQGDALITAMGLDPSQFDRVRRDELHILVGSLMRDVVEGLMQAMRARASIKNEFRMNVTTIQPVENNPLKFSADVNEAMENIFVRQSNAYKAPAEAVQEGFKEIAGHQMAMIAGMREAFEEMLKGFCPSKLERDFQRQQKPGPIAALQHGRYWRQYQAHYEGLTDNLERSFQQIFGDVFVQAYEDQLRRLAATRKP